MKKKFKGLFVVETQFQLQIVNYLKRFKSFEHFEELHVYNGCVSFDSSKYYFNFYSFKGVCRSIYYGAKLNRFYFETVVGNFSTNFTSIYILGVLNYLNINTIDDGIGTYVLMKYPKFYHEKFAHRLKNLSISVICSILKFPKRYRCLNLYEVTKIHYTPFPHFPNLSYVRKIKLFKKSPVNNMIIFLGTPIFNPDKLFLYIDILKSVSIKYPNVFYFPHPAEKTKKSLYNFENSFFDVINYHSDFQTYCLAFGSPTVVIGSKSTALLIVSILNPDSLRYFYDLEDSLSLKGTNILYDEILQLHGAKPLV